MVWRTHRGPGKLHVGGSLLGQMGANSMTDGIYSQHGRLIKSLNKFKNMPFMWENKNYLLKMKHDTSFLQGTSFAKYFNFSPKSDPFLVFPSTKQNLHGIPG